MPETSKKDLCQTFQYYLEKDLVKNVNLEIEKIKVFHEDNDPPDTGAASIIYNMNQNKKSLPTKKRKFSGEDLTELMKKTTTKENDEEEAESDIESSANNSSNESSKNVSADDGMNEE